MNKTKIKIQNCLISLCIAGEKWNIIIITEGYMYKLGRIEENIKSVCILLKLSIFPQFLTYMGEVMGNLFLFSLS